MNYQEPLGESATAVHVEFALSHLIEHSRIRNANAGRRLNGIENTIGALSAEWREWRPLVPEREIRMAESTRDALIAWLTVSEAQGSELTARLTPYTSGAILDERVSDGWVRLLLRDKGGS